MAGHRTFRVLTFSQSSVFTKINTKLNVVTAHNAARHEQAVWENGMINTFVLLTLKSRSYMLQSVGITLYSKNKTPPCPLLRGSQRTNNSQQPVIEPIFSGQSRNLVPKGKLNPRTGHEGPEGQQRYSSTLSLTSALDMGGWSTPRPGRFTAGKGPGTNCTGGWVGPRAGMDGCRKCRPRRDSILRPSSP